MSKQDSNDPFAHHSDVVRAYPDLFQDLDQTLVHTIRTTIAESILEGRSPSREAVQRRIQLITQD